MRMTMASCLFCRIRDGEIPARIVFQDELCLGFEDIRPEAPTHVLFIPREHVESAAALKPEHEALAGRLLRQAAEFARERGLAERGFRLAVNTGPDAGQTVFHLHVHLLGGRAFSWPPG